MIFATEIYRCICKCCCSNTTKAVFLCKYFPLEAALFLESSKPGTQASFSVRSFKTRNSSWASLEASKPGSQAYFIKSFEAGNSSCTTLEASNSSDTPSFKAYSNCTHPWELQGQLKFHSPPVLFTPVNYPVYPGFCRFSQKLVSTGILRLRDTSTRDSTGVPTVCCSI